MSDHDRSRDETVRTPEPEVIDPGSGDDRFDDIDEVLVSPQDIRSASRSCLAIIIISLLIVFLICLFLLLQPFID